jgi:hypothetical protein
VVIFEPPSNVAQMGVGDKEMACLANLFTIVMSYVSPHQAN